MKILTVDLEEWFHILEHETVSNEILWGGFEARIELNLERLTRLFLDNNQSATFFVLGWVAQKYPHLIKNLSSMGFEIAVHSNLHKLVYKQSKFEFREDLKLAINSIEDITGKKVKCYRAPGFSINENSLWAIEELISLGIEFDCSIFSAPRAHGGLSRFNESMPCIISTPSGQIKEFPMSTNSILGKKIALTGGGYFRLTPEFILRYFMDKSSYVMTYFHPRDFDPGQPVISDLSCIRKFKSYYGLNHSLAKLSNMLSSYTFISVEQANELVNWEIANVIDLRSI